MNSQWLLFIFLVSVIFLAADITRRALLTISKANNEKKIHIIMRQLRRPKQPSVTVLVYGQNQAAALERTVRKVRQSKYGVFDIVAVSDQSLDDSAFRMKRYMDTTNGRVPMQFLQRRKVGTKMDAYRAAYRKSQRGKIIICLTAGDEINSLLIKRAVALRRNRLRWQVEVQASNDWRGLIGLVKCLRAFLWGNSTIVQVYSPAALRRDRGANSSLLSAALQPLLFAMIILSVWYGGFPVLWYVWVLFSSYLLALIWIQNETLASEKWKFSFSVPSALFLIPVVGISERLVRLSIRK